MDLPRMRYVREIKLLVLRVGRTPTNGVILY